MKTFFYGFFSFAGYLCLLGLAFTVSAWVGGIVLFFTIAALFND